MHKVKVEFICMISQSKHVEQTQTVVLNFHFGRLFIRRGDDTNKIVTYDL